jgi:hypothetical protein
MNALAAQKKKLDFCPHNPKIVRNKKNKLFGTCFETEFFYPQCCGIFPVWTGSQLKHFSVSGNLHNAPIKFEHFLRTIVSDVNLRNALVLVGEIPSTTGSTVRTHTQ